MTHFRMNPFRWAFGGMATLAMLAILFVPGVAAAEEEWVEATGEAAIVGDNEVHAREMAQQQALRQAVEMVAGTIVSGISETQQFMTVRDEITSQGAGYVRRYEVQNTECGQGTCKVTVRALVSKQGLSQRLSDLGLLIQRRGYPRVVMFIVERNTGEERPSAWWSTTDIRSQVFENTLAQHLNQTLKDDEQCKREFTAGARCWTPLEPGMRFRIMDYRSVSTNPMVREAQAGVDLTDNQYRDLARLMDAEIAIIGTATAIDRGNLLQETGGALHSVVGEASVRVLSVDSAEVLGSATANAGTRHIVPQSGGDLMLQTVARQMAVEVQKIVTERWASEATGSRWVKIEVEGLTSYNDLMRIQELMRLSLTGVRSTQHPGMDGSRGEFSAELHISAEQLAAELSTRPLGDFTVRVTKVDSGTVGIRLGN